MARSTADNIMVHFRVPPDLAERVDDFRFEGGFPSRAEAIRHLLEAGLTAEAQRGVCIAFRLPEPVERRTASKAATVRHLIEVGLAAEAQRARARPH